MKGDIIVPTERAPASTKAKYRKRFAEKFGTPATKRIVHPDGTVEYITINAEGK